MTKPPSIRALLTPAHWLLGGLCLLLPLAAPAEDISARDAAVIEAANVRIEGNLIAEVSTNALPADGATVIDGEGRMLIPGLIDGHNHIMLAASPAALAYSMHWSYIGALVTREAEAMLMRGFTTLRDQFVLFG